jgi:Flp pilus assembly protein TadD
LKTDESITKGRAARRWRTAGLAVLIAAIAAGFAYQAYLHRPTSEAEAQEIERLIASGKSEEARVLMRDAQVRSKDVEALRLRIGRAFLRNGEIGPATALLSQVEPALIKEERLAVAEYFLVQGDPFSASRFYEAAFKTGLPRTAASLGRYGEALSLASNGDGAVAAFREALALDPTRSRIRTSLAITLANLNRFAESKVEAQEVLKVDPQNPKALNLLAALNAQAATTPGSR